MGGDYITHNETKKNLQKSLERNELITSIVKD